LMEGKKKEGFRKCGVPTEWLGKYEKKVGKGFGRSESEVYERKSF
jgi:hypothetical protein